MSTKMEMVVEEEPEEEPELQQVVYVAPEGEFNWDTSHVSFPAIKWLNALRKMVANHIRLPNSGKSGVPGNQHPRFQLHNTPIYLCRRRCCEAGLVQKGGVKRSGETALTTFKGDGPMSAYRFCGLKAEVKRWGVGSALLILNQKRPGTQGPNKQGTS
jgi:hypothetical protein